MSATEPSRLARLPLWVDALLVAAIAAAVYAQVIRHDFIALDDSLYVTGNARVLGGLTWESFIWAWSNFDAANYHPLTWLSYLIDIELFGPEAGWMAAENAIMHGINGYLVLLVLRELGCSRGAALLGALAFVAHPLNVESVAWVSQRKTVLASMPGLAAILIYLRRARSGRPPINWVVVLLVTASLLSKAWLVVVPALFLVLDIWILRRGARTESDSSGSTPPARLLEMWSRLWPLVREKFPLVVVTLSLSIAAILSQDSKGAIATTEVMPVSLRIENSVVSCVHYLSDALRLGGFSLFYSLPDKISPGKFYGSLCVLALISLAVIMARLRNGALLAGWLWFGIFLLPVSGIIQVGSQARADRYMYLPLIGLIWAMCHLAELAWVRMQTRTRLILPVSAGIWILLLCGVAHRQAGLWRNSFGIVGHSIAVSGATPRLLKILAVALLQDGRWDAAIPILEKSLRAEDQDSSVALNLALAYSKVGRMNEAITITRTILARDPTNFAAATNLVVFLHAVDDHESAADAEQHLSGLTRPTGLFAPPRQPLSGR